jgi:hypothetical protein
VCGTSLPVGCVRVVVGAVRVVVGAVRVDGVVVVRRSVFDEGVCDCVRSVGVRVFGCVREFVELDGAVRSPVALVLRVALLFGDVARCGVSPVVRAA